MIEIAEIKTGLYEIGVIEIAKEKTVAVYQIRVIEIDPPQKRGYEMKLNLQKKQKKIAQ